MTERTEPDPLERSRTDVLHPPPGQSDRAQSNRAQSDLARPLPPRRITDQARAWVAWFGVPRMLALGVTTLLVGGGGYWLLQAPPPPVEASLPFAATTTTVTEALNEASAIPTDVSSAAGTTVPSTSPPLPTFVHVAGAVAAPGVYQLPPGSRVVNAVDAAGGPTPDAALDGLNLAAFVADGQRVYVPVVGEVDPATVANGPSGPVATGGPTSPGSAEATPVDVNRATAVELETLPGVGPATAAAIIDDRERNGPFATVDDLDRVSGIGPATLEALRDLVTV